MERVGPVDVLVNAGVSGVRWYVDRTLAETDHVVTLNLLAPMHLCRLVLPGMLQRGRGQVVNLSSMAAVLVPPQASRRDSRHGADRRAHNAPRKVGRLVLRRARPSSCAATARVRDAPRRVAPCA